MINSRTSIWVLLSSLLMACAPGDSQNGAARENSPAGPVLCTQEWFEYVDALVATGDGMGHGPDIGSEEWRSVVEFKLGMRGNPEVPDRESAEWCGYIAKQIDARSL